MCIGGGGDGDRGVDGFFFWVVAAGWWLFEGVSVMVGLVGGFGGGWVWQQWSSTCLSVSFGSPSL